MIKPRFSISAAAISFAVAFLGIIVSIEFSGLLRLRGPLSPVGMTVLAVFVAPAIAIDWLLDHFHLFLSGYVALPVSCIVWGCAAGLTWPFVSRRDSRTI